MSLYIINHRIRFDEKNGSLGLVDSTETEIVLPSPASRLLFVLVTNNDKILTKEEILTEVWERHGWVASNSNLYHYISIVRKSLSKLGEEKIITTIPKVGFRLTAESVFEDKKVHCTGDSDSDSDSDIIDNESIVANENLTHHKEDKKSIFTQPLINNKFLLILFFIGLSLLLWILFSFYLGHAPRKENKPTLLARVGECEVYQLKENLSAPDNENIETINSRIKKALLDCSKKSVIYISDGYNYRLTYYCTMTSYKKPDPARCFNEILDSEASL